MNEPELIRSSAPHQVSVSEGSKVAGGKKAGAAEHSVRKTLAGEDPAPIQQQAPEFKLSPRITPTAAPAQPDLPPPVQSRSEEEGASVALPAAFQSAAEPEAGVLLEQRSIQDDVQAFQGEIPERVGDEQTMADLPEALPDVHDAGGESVAPAPTQDERTDELVLLPESVAQPKHEDPAEAPPVTDRAASEHRVAVPESLAAPDVSQAEAPVLQRSEQDHRASLPEPLPSDESLAPDDAPVLMRGEQDQVVQVPESLAEPLEQVAAEAPVLERSQYEAMAAVPEALPAEPAADTEGPIVSRASSDTVVELPPELPAAEAAADGPLISRHEDEHLAAVPPAQAVVSEPTTGPVIGRAENDTLVAVPESAAAQPPAEGPLITRSESDTMAAVPEATAVGPAAEGPVITRSDNDNRVAVPEAEPRLVSDPDMPPPAAGRAELDLAEAAPREPEEIVELVELVEVPDKLALTAVEPAAELPAPVTEVTELSAQAKARMVQMDFPARVVKLKIANDKVRVQLDALEAPERPRR